MGVKIKEFIDRIGIKSQEELATRLGVSSNTISLWAKGKRYPAHQMEIQLYELGMTTEELFGKAYPSSANTARDDFDRKAGFLMRKLFDKIDKL